MTNVETTPEKPSRAAIFGWMMFDWAAQPFFTVVITFIFSPYFVSRMVADPDQGQQYWSNINVVSSIIIALLAPVMGAVADASGYKKRWIGAFAVVKIVSLLLLWQAAPGSSVLFIGLLIVLASIAAEFSIVFNDSMMPRLVDNANAGKISNIAWGLGYAGGLVSLFAVLLFMAGSPQTGKTLIGLDPIFGLDPAQGEDARVTGPLSAIWYLVFILPMFLFTPDIRKSVPIGRAVGQGLRELRGAILSLGERKPLLRFLIARMIYQDGVNGLLILGGAYGAAMFGWETTEVGLYGIMLAVVAIFGCWAAGHLDGAFGSKNVVILCLFLLLIATIGDISTTRDFTLFGLIPLVPGDTAGLFSTQGERIYILFGLLIGLAFGPVQASSRSFMSRSVDAEEAGRYFGLYALSGRATTFMATGLNSLMIWASGSARVGMASLIVFFVVGLVLLIATPYPARNKA